MTTPIWTFAGKGVEIEVVRYGYGTMDIVIDDVDTDDRIVLTIEDAVELLGKLPEAISAAKSAE